MTYESKIVSGGAVVPVVECPDDLSISILSKKEIAFQRRLSTLDKVGVTDERLARVLDEGLNAELIEETVNNDGTITKTVVPNHIVRDKFLDKGMKARDWYATDIKVSAEVSVGHRLVLTAEDRAHLLFVADRLKSMNSLLEMGDVQDGEIVSEVNTGG